VADSERRSLRSPSDDKISLPAWIRVGGDGGLRFVLCLDDLAPGQRTPWLLSAGSGLGPLRQLPCDILDKHCAWVGWSVTMAIIHKSWALLVILVPSRCRVEDLVRGQYIVGNSSVADVKLRDRSVAPEHALLRLIGSTIEISDLGSTTGTFVNDKRISGPTPVGIGSLLQLGSVKIRVLAGGRVMLTGTQEFIICLVMGILFLILFMILSQPRARPRQPLPATGKAANSAGLL